MDCALCGAKAAASDLAEAGWADAEVRDGLAREHPGWLRADGACPACVQQTLLKILVERGEDELHEGIQSAWPLDPEAAFGALPTPLRLHADPRFTGKGVTLAIVDAAFYPHPDLVRHRNRIRAWVDASREPVEVRSFAAQDRPDWPGWDAARAGQWHGLMTSAAAAGSGELSHGLYRGLAPEADLVLVQVLDGDGRIADASIARALHWLRSSAPLLGVRVANLSLGGDPVTPLAGNPVDEAVEELVSEGVTVVVAAGNDGVRRLVPPGTAPGALTVGGLDDRNTFDHTERQLWHGNYGEAAAGLLKPEVVAPSLWVVAPILPGTDMAAEAAKLFAARARGDAPVEERIAALKLVTPHYQHVEGTSFASPIVASIVACMLEANPALTPCRIRELLVAAAHAVPGVPAERQGSGAVDAGRAVTLALADQHGPDADYVRTPLVGSEAVRFLLHDHRASVVRLLGSWDRWERPARAAVEIEPGLWEVRVPTPGPGRHAYKFLLDDVFWLCDPANPARAHDGYGGFNSLLDVSAAH